MGRRPALILMLLVLLVTTSCGGGQEPAAISGAGSQFAQALRLLPANGSLGEQILFADAERLRSAYGDSRAFRRALAGLWLPDALVGSSGPLWPRAYGFGLGAIDRFVASGFHPRELTIALGRFRPKRIEAALRARGYANTGELLRRGRDGSVDARTPAGRLALSSVDRVAVSADRLVAASTTALAQAALRAGRTPSTDLALAANALGNVTSAIVLSPRLIRPPSGVPVRYLAANPAVLVAAGLDDRGPRDRSLTIVLVYADASQAAVDAAIFRQGLAAAPLAEGGTFGMLVEHTSVDVVGQRAVVIRGLLAPSEGAESWRGLFESGDLAALVRQG